jgi:hypothetical protein
LDGEKISQALALGKAGGSQKRMNKKTPQPLKVAAW